MIKLDDALLREVGLGDLRPDLARLALTCMYELLEIRVGFALAQKMSDQQHRDFGYYIDYHDEAGALTWLEREFPDYRDTVASHFEELKSEVTSAAPAILHELSRLLTEDDAVERSD